MNVVIFLLRGLIGLLNIIGFLSLLMGIGIIIDISYRIIKYKSSFVPTTKEIIKNRILTPKYFTLLFCVGIAWAIISPVLESTTMGGIFEKANYEEYYYVEMYKGEDLIGTFPALIRSETYEEEYNDKIYSYRVYYVDKVQVVNDLIWCDSEGISLEEIKNGNMCNIMDSSMGAFDVIITTSKVDKKALQFE